MKHREDSAIAWAAIDFLCCLLLVVYMLIAPPVKSKPSIDTLGYYAVVVTWRDGSTNDVDTYVEDPQDHIVYFANPQTGLMHLEQDDLGTGVSNTTSVNGRQVVVKQNQERVILQGIVPGEYIVNVHLYSQRQHTPEPVTIKLYRLRGEDEVLITQHVVLQREGDQKTAFRFTLNSAGHMCCVNHLQKNLVGAVLGNTQGSGDVPPGYGYGSYPNYPRY